MRSSILAKGMEKEALIKCDSCTVAGPSVGEGEGGGGGVPVTISRDRRAVQWEVPQDVERMWVESK